MTTTTPPPGHPDISPLATADQAEVERTALRLMARPDIQQALADARALFLADEYAAIPAGRLTLEQAVNETVLARVIATVIDDVAKPRIVWVDLPAHRWFGHDMPGSRFLIDNPDCPYRTAILDPTGSYEIRGRQVNGGLPALSFQLYADNTYGTAIPSATAAKGTSQFRELLKAGKIDTPRIGLLGENMTIAQDGSYRVTLDPEPANGRPNHLQLHEQGRCLLIRCAHNDWKNGTPDWMEIRRLDPPPHPAPLNDDHLAAQAIEHLGQYIPFFLKFTHFYMSDLPANALQTPPRARGGAFGYSASGAYRLADDEVMLVTIERQNAGYIGFCVYDPWSISREYVYRSGSLNDTQSYPNPDGSFTYAIAPRDPGLANWLDTGGLDFGGIDIRWQAFKHPPDAIENMIRDVRVLKRAELEQQVPGDTPRLSPGQRRVELEKRARTFERRFSH